MTIGFLLNHSAAHQVAHVVPIANALAKIAPALPVNIFVSGGAVETEARRLAAQKPNLSVRRLREAHRPAAMIERASGGALPAKRISVLAANLDRFRPLRALVVPEKTSLLLKSMFGLRHLRLIHTRHGAGDRAVGFDQASGKFDFVLLSGPKIRDRLEAGGLLTPGNHAIVGYPKFDILEREGSPRRFPDDKPTILYNPHPSPALSSWYAMGREILEYLAADDRLNTLFAPHAMLFAKRFNISLSPFAFGKVGDVPPRVAACPSVHVDKGSQASVDMTYTRQADIYLGDVSSQVYEFLVRPRPCIFLNPRRRQWQEDENFTHWHAGQVVNDIAGLDMALRLALLEPDHWRDRQERLFAHTFDLDAAPSSQRAAKAIIGYLDRA